MTLEPNADVNQVLRVVWALEGVWEGREEEWKGGGEGEEKRAC